MQQYNNFKSAPWFEKSQEESIVICGMGGIGSNALYNLVRTIPLAYYIIADGDNVEQHNIGTQFFNKGSIGKKKVEAIRAFMVNNFGSLNISTIPNFIKEDTIIPYNIIISAFDNMKARKMLYNIWKNNPDREILIDGRLRANVYEIYTVTPGMEEEYEKTLFDDSEVDDGPCTFKQTAYFGMLIGARITQIVVNYLSNKYSDEPIYKVPFKVYEFGDVFLIDVV